MAWKDIAIPVLRVLINDLEDTPIYGDDRLTQLLMVAALLISQEISFDTIYTIDFVGETITPDPSTDTIFINFLVMKAACQADFSTFRTKALREGISAKCGPTALTVMGNTKGFSELLTIGPCAAYDTMRKDYMFGNGTLCKAILSPFTSNSFDPQNLAMLGLSSDVDHRGHYE